VLLSRFFAFAIVKERKRSIKPVSLARIDEVIDIQIIGILSTRASIQV
jgi:hypothetical protein